MGLFWVILSVFILNCPQAFLQTCCWNHLLTPPLWEKQLVKFEYQFHPPPQPPSSSSSSPAATPVSAVMFYASLSSLSSHCCVCSSAGEVQVQPRRRTKLGNWENIPCWQLFVQMWPTTWCTRFSSVLWPSAPWGESDIITQQQTLCSLPYDKRYC